MTDSVVRFRAEDAIWKRWCSIRGRSTAVLGNEYSLSGCQSNKIISLCRQTLHAQRANKANRALLLKGADCVSKNQRTRLAALGPQVRQKRDVDPHPRSWCDARFTVKVSTNILGILVDWRPQGDSNPCCRRERAVS